MNIFQSKKKIAKDLLSDNSITSDFAIELLKQQRADVARMCKLSFADSRSVYEQICLREKMIQKYGHEFVTVSTHPYIYCLTSENYGKFLQQKRINKYLLSAIS